MRGCPLGFRRWTCQPFSPHMLAPSDGKARVAERRPTMADYHYVSTWQLQAPIQQVWAALTYLRLSSRSRIGRPKPFRPRE